MSGGVGRMRSSSSLLDSMESALELLFDVALLVVRDFTSTSCVDGVVLVVCACSTGDSLQG